MYEHGREWMWQLSQGQFTLLNSVAGLVALAFAFLPTVIALLRGHHNTLAIFLTNLLLGWTGIGWIVALIWSMTAIRAPAPPR